ncbi:MAG: hypothetical protein ACYDBB_10525 [Armatimonadota bacterium]
MVKLISTEFKGHRIEVENEPTLCRLLIDGQTQDIFSGRQLTSPCTLRGSILDGRDQGDNIEVKISHTKFQLIPLKVNVVEVEVFYNGRIVKTR